MNKLEILKKYFGHTEFRYGQEEIIDCLLSKRDTLCVMPTGAGKSACYQIPALMLDGITLVVSPLVSLMKDQVTSLTQAGIDAAYINSSLSTSQYYKVLENAKKSKYKLIYIAPERLVTQDFIDICSVVNVSMVAVDEAHCVSHWGQDFRPTYLRIVEFINKLAYRPVIGAFTATATKEVEEDISCILQLQDPLTIVTGFDRKNLSFEVRKPKDKDAQLINILKEEKDNCGIIYCATRKNVETVCETLCKAGFLATRYHAGLKDEERKQNQEDFIFDKKQIIVATNAFGMGIDKSNVSFVIHYNMPKSMEGYYQEAGRAGRDGERARCIILYSQADVRTNAYIIDNSEINTELDLDMQEAVREKERERLKKITYYCTTTDCLRAYILKYFGEITKDYCGNCSNCNTSFKIEDITINAQKILSCIAKNNSRFGIKMIVDILRGSKNERLLRLKLDDQSTYGIMSDISEKKVRSILNFLLLEKYIATSNSEYPVLCVTSLAKNILKNGEKLSMKALVTEEVKVSVDNKYISQDIDLNLLGKLKELRKEIATKQRVPAYIIFTDAALKDMCLKKPKTLVEFLDIAGVGKTKQEKYGEAFLAAIN
ncbi:MAG: DNA helicase RecQ [Clostridia bacterium]